MKKIFVLRVLISIIIGAQANRLDAVQTYNINAVNNSQRIAIDDVSRIFLSYNNFVAPNMVGIVGFTGIIEEAELKQTLKIMQQRHPSLGVRIENENSTYFTTLNVSEIPLRTVTRLNDTQWQFVVFDELHQPFILNVGPLVRVIYLKGADQGELIITFNHIIADGISRAFLSIELFEIIHALREQLPIACDSDNFWTADRQSALAGLGQQEIDTMRNDKNGLYKQAELCEPLNIIDSRRTNFIPHDFSPEETACIQEKYRAHNSSLQGILSAAMAQVIAEKVRTRTGLQFPKVICHHPINFRPYYKPQLRPSEVGMYVSVIEDETEVNPDGNVWNFAAEVKATLQKSINSNRHLKLLVHNGYSAVAKPSDYEVFMKVQSHKPTVVVSQLGTITTAENYSDLRIQFMRGVFNWSTAFNHKDVFMVTGLILNSSLQLTFGYVYPYVDHEEARFMADKVIKKLLSNMPSK